MSKPIRIVQFGMSDTLGGVETFIMNLYRILLGEDDGTHLVTQW